MHPHRGAVDQQMLVIASRRTQASQDSLPQPTAAPAPKAGIHGLPWPEGRW
jgi:hypothetical protein